MAVVTTPLGFQKPDGNELVKQGDNVISVNAQKAQDLHAKARADIVNLQAAAGFDGDPLVMQDAVVAELLTTESVTSNAIETLVAAAVDQSSDAAVASNINTPTSETAAALNAAYAPLSVVTDVAAKADAVTVEANATKVSDASDPLAYLNSMDVLCQFNARPEGTLWPQGISVNEEAKELYVSMNGSLDGGTTTSLRISIRNYDGTVKSEKTITTQPATSSEGLPWFYGSGGDLCFIIRPETAGVGYAVYNYTTGTVGPTIPVKGNYKSDVEGNIFVTCDQTSASSGVGMIYLYDWASIRAGVPVLLDTVVLESRNYLNKVQSFAINAGNIIFSHGASKTEPHLSVYTLTGKLVTMYQLDKPTFADAINKYAPGTITDRLSYRHESEGAATLGGKLLTGHVTDNNTSSYTFTVVRHNQVDGASVKTLAQPALFDTGWLPLPLGPGVIEYSAGSPPEYRRVGREVYLRGAVKGVAATPSSALVGTLPAGFRPAANIVTVQTTSGAFTANWQINPAGTIYVLNSQHAGASTSSWYPLPTVKFLID